MRFRFQVLHQRLDWSIKDSVRESSNEHSSLSHSEYPKSISSPPAILEDDKISAESESSPFGVFYNLPASSTTQSRGPRLTDLGEGSRRRR